MSYIIHVTSFQEAWELDHGYFPFTLETQLDLMTGWASMVVYHEWNGELHGAPNCPTWNEVTECKCMLAPEEQ